MRVFLGLCLASAAALCATVPAGTQLEIRLKTKVASNASKAHDAVEAVLISPVFDQSGIVLPAGAAIKGEVKEASAIKQADQRAALALDFTSLALPSGKTLKIESKLAGVDNAREKVENGRINGILASETLAARIQSGIGRVSQSHSGLGDFLGTVSSAVLKEPEPEIVYEAGVEMTLELTKPVEAATNEPVTGPAAVGPEADLFKTVNAQPFQTAAENGVPSDLTNLMFVGSQEQLEAVFKEAGWSGAARLNTSSGLETFRAIAEMRGYKEAPMSVLYLDQRAPDLDFEKQNNTFAMRHHLRIWRRPGDFQGQPVWVCAATHDIGIEFSPEHRNFIHKIDSQIDRERAKVVADLTFTGKVKALSLVERTSAPKQSRNATGDQLITDGRMAVMVLE